jgi:hypothetical protein
MLISDRWGCPCVYQVLQVRQEGCCLPQINCLRKLLLFFDLLLQLHIGVQLDHLLYT